MIDIYKIDKLIQYIVLTAGQEDDRFDRELGPIHLIKYLYLADLSYAEHHDGETYTGLPWRFYHYGPYCEEAFLRIEPALMAINADKKIIESTRFEDDMIRWSKSEDELYNQLFNELDLSVTGAVNRQVHLYGTDTSKLLDFTYKTKPMLDAAPGDMLDFTYIREVSPSYDTATPACEPLTRRQEKKRAEQLSQLKSKLKQRLSQRRQPKFRYTPPRYDEVFFKGLNQLEASAEGNLSSGDYQASFSEDIWKSKARSDPGLS